MKDEWGGCDVAFIRPHMEARHLMNRILGRGPPLGVVPVTAATDQSKPNVARTFFRKRHFLVIVHASVIVLVTFIANAYPAAGIPFVPPSLPTQWGTFFLVPLILQPIMAGLSIRTLTSPTWFNGVFMWAVVCMLLVLWSIANIVASMVLYLPTLSGLALLQAMLGLFYAALAMIVVSAFELEAIVMLVPLVFPTLWVGSLTARRMRDRLKIMLLTMLVFVLVCFLFCWHAEPDTRLVLEFWPTSLSHPATFWLLPQPLLYILALVLLVIRPGRTEAQFILTFIIIDAAALLMSLMGLGTTIWGLIVYVPTAAPFTPVIAGTILVLLAALVSPIVDIAVLLSLASMLPEKGLLAETDVPLTTKHDKSSKLL